MKRNKIDYFAVVSAIAALSIIFYFLLSGYSECSAIGGEYVKGLFWFKCIK